MPYNVLAIAPSSPDLQPLAVADELARIGDVQNVVLTQLTGPVTQQRIIDRLSRGQYDAVLWSGHAAPGHLLLNKTETVEPRWLASQLRQSGVKLIAISACQSGVHPNGTGFMESFSDTLPASGISCILMMISVEDRAAIEFDVALFQALAAGEKLRRAYNVGMEAISRFPGMVQAPLLIPADQIANDVEILREKMDSIDQELIQKHPEQARKLIAEMVGTLDDLDERIARTYDLAQRTAERVDKLEMQVNPPPLVWVLRIMAFAIVLFAGTLFWVKDIRDVLFSTLPIIGIAVEIMMLAWALSIYRLAVVTNKNQQSARRGGRLS